MIEFITSNFSNREIASYIWATLIIVIVAIKFPILPKIRDIIQVSLNKTIIGTYTLVATYIFAMVYVFYLMGIFDTFGLFKTGFFWFFSVGLSSLFKFDKIKNDESFIKKELVSNIKLMAILSFLLNAFSFKLYIEIIAVPIIAYNYLRSQFVKDKALKSRYNTRLLYILLIYCISFFIWVKYNINSFEKIQGFTLDFFLPVFFYLCYIPFLYLFSILVFLESFYARMGRHLKTPELNKYFRKKLRFRYYYRLWTLRDLEQLLVIQSSIQSKSDIDKLFKEFERIVKEKKNPLKIEASYGWSPHEASTYLREFDLVTRMYKTNDVVDYYFADSKYIYPDRNSLCKFSHIRYSITGSQSIVKKCEIRTSIYRDDNEECILSKLSNIITTLAEESASITLEIKKQLEEKQEFSIEYEDYIFELVFKRFNELYLDITFSIFINMKKK